jgi:hypothetical protein
VPKDVEAVAALATVDILRAVQDVVGGDRRSFVAEFTHAGVRQEVPLLGFGIEPLDLIWLPHGQTRFATGLILH